VLATVPVPGPVRWTVTRWLAIAKRAVTVVGEVMSSRHGPVPVQAPSQPVKTDPAPAVAVNVTVLPYRMLAEHVVPQSMPSGALVTVPPPGPPSATSSRRYRGPKVAVTVRARSIVTVQAPVEPHAGAPVQPWNVESAAAAADSVTTVPGRYAAVHDVPHASRPSPLVTVPVPAPAVRTASGSSAPADRLRCTCPTSPGVCVCVPTWR
jgi:hypothetical protein